MIKKLISYSADFLTRTRTGASTSNQEQAGEIIQSIHALLDNRRSRSEKVADALVFWFGTFTFVFFHVALFTLWIAVNIHLIPGFTAFDPYPFNFLTMTVSLEAIFLSIFVLISQNRASKIADLREELDMQVDLMAEREVTKVIHLMAHLMTHLNVPPPEDPELRKMMEPLNIEEMREVLERELRVGHQKKSPPPPGVSTT